MLKQRFGFRTKITLAALLPVTIIGVLVILLFMLYRPSILGGRRMLGERAPDQIVVVCRRLGCVCFCSGRCRRG